jgi:hypothetical protein
MASKLFLNPIVNKQYSWNKDTNPYNIEDNSSAKLEIEDAKGDNRNANQTTNSHEQGFTAS